MRWAILLVVSAAAVQGLAVAEPEAKPELVADLGDRVPWPWPISAGPVSVRLGDEVFFLHDDGLHGTELWASDGTAPGTRLVVDLCPGRCGIERGFVSLASLDASATHILLAGNDGISGHEPWISDGTAAGTFQLGDLWPGPDGSLPWLVTAFPGGFAFTADDGVHGRELWVSDGTPGGTRLLVDLTPGPSGSSITAIVGFGDRLFVNVATGTLAGAHLVTLDGAVTSLGVTTGQSLHQAYGRRPVVLDDGDLLFVEPSGANTGVLWRLDLETFALTAIAGPELVGPVPRGIVLGRLGGGALVPVQESGGAVLGYTDGVDLTVEAGSPLILSGWFASNLFASLGDRVVFPGATGLDEPEPWVWIPGAGSTQLADVVPGSDGPFRYSIEGECFICLPPYSIEVAGRVLISLDDPSEGRSLWSSDGTPGGTSFLSSVGADGPGGYVTEPSFGWGRHARLADGSLLLRVWQDDGIDLWRTDATPAGTGVVARVATGTDAFRLPASMFGSQLARPHFTHLASHGRAVVQVLSQPYPGPESSWWLLDSGGPTQLLPPVGSGSGRAVEHNGAVVLLAAEDDLEGDRVHRLWRLAPGTSVLESIDGLPAPAGADAILSAGGWLWYPTSAPDGVARSDLTPEGTTSYPIEGWSTMVPGAAGLLAAGTTAQILPWGNGQPAQVADGSGSLAMVYPTVAAPLGDGFVLVARREDSGAELWYSDGTIAGTHLIRDVRSGSGDGIPAQPFSSRELPRIARFGERVVFLADDGVAGAEPWITDGVAAERLVDLRPGPLGSWPQDFHAVGDRAVFVADDGVHGRELWVLDPAALVPSVVDLLPGPESSRPEVLATRDPFVYLAAWEPTFGRELWRLDLRDLGLERLTDLVPGPGSASPIALEISGRTLWLIAHDGVHGLELFTLDDPALAPIFSDGFESGTTSAWSSSVL